jgi:DNA-binding NarL/FixJ family response regulator
VAPSRNAAPSGRRLFVQFALSGLAAMLIVALAATIVLRRAGETESVRDARRLTEVLGRSVVEPNLTDGVVSGNRTQLAAFDRLVHARVLRSPVVRVKLWTSRGRIVYSDEPRLIGARYPLGDDEIAALRGNGVEAGISDLSAPENRYERRQDKLLEVYMPVHTQSGRPLLFEAYLRFSDVAASGRKVWLAFLPAVFAALLMLWLLQLPIAVRLARRVRRAHAEREALLLRALNASDTERRTIAADLHDGVVLPHRTGGAAQRRGACRRGNVQHRRPCERQRRGAPRRRRRPGVRTCGARGASRAGTLRTGAARRSGGGSRRQHRHRLDPGLGHARPAEAAGTMIRVLVAGDHAVVRDGLEQLVRSADDLEFVGGAGEGGEAVEVAVARKPDVVLMDLSMPGIDGIEATRRLVKRVPGVQVVVLTSFSDRGRILGALEAGAVGYLLKDATPEELLNGIRAAARGESPLAPKAARTLLDAHVDQEQEPLRGREREILALVAAGHPNKIIARRLGISEKTVKSHLTSVYRQIGVTDRVQAALWAREHGVTS